MAKKITRVPEISLEDYFFMARSVYRVVQKSDTPVLISR